MNASDDGLYLVPLEMPDEMPPDAFIPQFALFCKQFLHIILTDIPHTATQGLANHGAWKGLRNGDERYFGGISACVPAGAAYAVLYLPYLIANHRCKAM